MYRIAILTEEKALGKQLEVWTASFWTKRGYFPLIELYEDSEFFYEMMRDRPPRGVVVVLPGVQGLNAVEHLHSLKSDCGLIWCSDLDFSLHAYRMRADYFILGPVTEEELGRGMDVWRERCKSGRAAETIQFLIEKSAMEELG